MEGGSEYFQGTLEASSPMGFTGPFMADTLCSLVVDTQMLSLEDNVSEVLPLPCLRSY